MATTDIAVPGRHLCHITITNENAAHRWRAEPGNQAQRDKDHAQNRDDQKSQHWNFSALDRDDLVLRRIAGVRSELKDLQQKLGITTIYVTHDQEDANAIADRIAVLDQGCIQQVGVPIDLYDHPANRFVATFL